MNKNPSKKKSVDEVSFYNSKKVQRMDKLFLKTIKNNVRKFKQSNNYMCW